MNAAGFDLGVRFQKFADTTYVDLATTRERNVRMPRTQLWLEPGGKGRLLHAFVDLKEMRMTSTNSDPEDFRGTFCWKCAKTEYQQKECAELDQTELFSKSGIQFGRHVAEKTKCKMQQVRVGPAHASEVWIQPSENLFQ